MGMKDKNSSSESDFKLLEYIVKMNKEPLHIQLGSVDKVFPAITKFVINPNFWLADTCLGCGRCCRNFGMAYFKEEYDNMSKLTDDQLKELNVDTEKAHSLMSRLKPVTAKFNGKEVVLYTHSPVPSKECVVNTTEGRNFVSCPYVVEKDDLHLCSVHGIRSFTCKFPHMRFYQGNNRHEIAYVATRQYGRNWALKCYAEFGEPSLEAVRKKLSLLEEFNHYVSSIGVKTWLPDIIEYIKSNMSQFEKGIFPTKDIVFKANSQRKLF